MLAMVDRNGEVHASIPGLAKRAGISLNECEEALSCLLSPDPYSRTKEHEGRRIGVIDGGWELLNHAKYRALLSAEERREYNRKKQAEYRSKSKNVNDMSITVNHSEQNAHITDADTESDIKELPMSIAIDVKTESHISTLWKTFNSKSRERSSLKQLESEWKKTKEKPDMATLVKSIEIWNNSKEWSKDNRQFASGAHLFIKNRKWEVIPEPHNQNTKHATGFRPIND